MESKKSTWPIHDGSTRPDAEARSSKELREERARGASALGDRKVQFQSRSMKPSFRSMGLPGTEPQPLVTPSNKTSLLKDPPGFKAKFQSVRRAFADAVKAKPSSPVPRLRKQADYPREMWTYKSGEAHLTTLCHSWLFRRGAPPNLMAALEFALSRDLDECTAPKVRIRSWKTAMLVKISAVMPDPEKGEPQECFADVFISVVDSDSRQAVATRVMDQQSHRVVVSGRGPVGLHGKGLWAGGYSAVLDSVQAALVDYPNAVRQVICPDCLSGGDPRVAGTWASDYVLEMAQSGFPVVHCSACGHKVDSYLLCGMYGPSAMPRADAPSIYQVSTTTSGMMRSVVQVGLWDDQTSKLHAAGSGFVIDKEHGLIVTAARVLYVWMRTANCGAQNLGIQGVKVIVGVIPHESGERQEAVFQYIAKVVAYSDIRKVDACVLQIVSRLSGDSIARPKLEEELPPTLDLAPGYHLEENVHILGFDQGSEYLQEKGNKVDFAQPYICKEFRVPEKQR